MIQEFLINIIGREVFWTLFTGIIMVSWVFIMKRVINNFK